MSDEEKSGELQDAGEATAPGLTDLGEPGTHQDDEARQGDAAPKPEPKPESWVDKVPEKFRSATAEEAAVKAATAFMEVEKEKGRLAQEQGELRRAVEWLAAERQRYLSQPQPQPEAQPEPEAKESGWWEHPEEAARKLVDERLGRFVSALSQAQVASNFQRAAQAHDQGKSIMSKETRLFEGIEGDVERDVYDSLRPLAERGQDVSGALIDPQTWRLAAVMRRYARGEVDRLTPNMKGMSATQTETPNSTKPQGDEEQIDIDESDRRFAEAAFTAAGMDKKSAREAANKVAKETLGRER